MDKKISQLTALTTADQADVYAIVDTSATETKKITQDNLEDTIANSTNFVDELVGNTYFTTELANDANFISELTDNSSFQSAVNNFVTTVGGSGGGAGGKPITFSLTDTVTAASNPLSGYSDAEAVVYSNGAIIYTQDAIGYTQSRDTSLDWASATTVVSYVLLNAYAYVLLSSGAALRVYRYNRNDLSAGGTLMTVSGATLTYGANVVMTSNGVEFYINYDAGQSANSYSIAKFTLSGTTLTYVAATSAGSTANQFAGAFAVDSLINYYGTNAGIIYQYDNAGALQVTSGSTLATISRLFNWDNTLYGCDSAGQFFNKLYMQDTDLTGGSVDLVVFTVDGTWTKPTGAKKVLVEVFGAGGGGGGGGLAATTNPGSGGGAGGGASYNKRWFDATDLGATVAVTVGVGGAGGAGTNTGPNGSAGSAGTGSSFGSLINAYGGNGGGPGGQNSAGAAGTGGTVSIINPENVGGAGGAGSASVGTGVAGSGGVLGLGGGGGGAGCNVGSSAAGADGGTTNSVTTGGGAAGGASGANGSNGTDIGEGGGGGGSNAAGTAGNGGNGGVGAGGGGGGGSNNSGISGDGGDGGRGEVRVTTFS